MKMIAIGDNVVDCYIEQKLFYPGGNAVNVAVNCKRYGFRECAYIGIFGNDEKAKHIQWVLTQEGITFENSRFAIGTSGQPRVVLSSDGDRRFVGGPKNTVQHVLKIKLTPSDLQYVSQYDICHSSCYSSIEAELPAIKEYCDISFDFSMCRDRSYLEKVCSSIKYAFFSGSDLTFSEARGLLRLANELGAEIVGVTLGERGSMFLKNGQLFQKDIQKTEVIDTMGAGDSFIAGFLTSYLRENNMNTALDYATNCAAEACTYYGAIGYPAPLSENDLIKNY